MQTPRRVARWMGWAFAGLLIASPVASQPTVGATAIGFEAGLPLVLGIDASYRISPAFRLGLSLGRLSGLTSIRAEGRWLLRAEAPQRFVPSVGVGAEQYFLSQGSDDATPVGVHFLFGIDYFFETPVSAGLRIGGLKTFGSEGGDLKVLSVRNGYETGIVNVGLRYHF